MIVPVKGSAQLNAEAIKRSSGALLKVNISRERNLAEVCETLKASGLQLVGCTEKAEELYFEEDYKKPTAVIMGSEEDGINSTIIKECDSLVKIPMIGEVASLNVSVATGILLAEVLRQRM